MSWRQRYRGGEREAVWNEIRQLGPVPDLLRAEVDAVATETMRRVAVHVRRLAEALAELGLASGVPSLPLHQPPTTDELADLDPLEREIGGLPSALRACMREVGTVWFAGDYPVLGLAYDREPDPGVLPEGVLPDPLCVLGAESCGTTGRSGGTSSSRRSGSSSGSPRTSTTRPTTPARSSSSSCRRRSPIPSSTAWVAGRA